MTPLFKPYIPSNLSMTLSEILKSGQLVNGKWGKMFESELRCFLENDNLIITNSYSVSVQIALATLGLKTGDEVIVSPMCCLQSSQPLVAFGLKLVWADIDPLTGTLCPYDLKKKVSKATKAIIHNHHLGYIGYIKDIAEIASEYGLLVIDDCVDGIGGEYQNQKVGNTGADASIFSFGAVRLPNAVDGGAVSFKDNKFVSMAIKTRDLGVDRAIFRTERGEINPKCDISSLGFAGVISEINAYIGYKQMSDLGYLLKKQRTNASLWAEFIKDKKLGCNVLETVKDSIPNYWVMGLLSTQRNELVDYFKGQGFSASQVHLNNDRYSLFGEYKELAGVSEFYNKFLAIPSGWWVEKDLIFDV